MNNKEQEEYEKGVRDCIKSEMEIFYPEEYERVYGSSDKECLREVDKLLKSTVTNLSSVVNHLNQRHTICDLVDDKTPEETDNLKTIWNLCEQISKKMEKIYTNP